MGVPVEYRRRGIRDRYCGRVLRLSRRALQRRPDTKKKMGKTRMDTGIWATWYDVDPGQRQELHDWMHSTYFPFLKQLPGIAWVAHYEEMGGGEGMKTVGSRVERPSEDIGSATEFAVLVGATTPQVFFNPLIYDVEKEARFAGQLAKRKGLRSVILSEQTRVNGPSAHLRTPGTTPGPAIQMGAFRMRTLEQEIDLGCWYAQYRLPFMAHVPSCIAARKMVSVVGWAKHSILYEFTSLEGRMNDFEHGHEELALDPKEWTGRIVVGTIHAPGSPTVARRIWPPVQ
jgi:hypothetical protein